MIRDYESRDWPEVCRVYDLSKPIELKAAGIEASFLPLACDMPRIEQFGTCAFRVWEEDGRLLGFVGARRNFVGWLFVEPTSFRRGIARTLLRVAIDAMEGDAWLWALKQNLAALELYRREGFRIAEERPTQNGGLLCMALRLERGRR